MINESDRNFLINYRIKQSKETIELAKFLIDSNQLSVAVNRIYYGLYYWKNNHQTVIEQMAGRLTVIVVPGTGL